MCIVDLQDGWRFGAAFLYKGEVHFAMLTHPEDQPFFYELGMVKTSREWAPDTQRDHCWGFVAACAAIPCRIFRWLVSLLILTPTPEILKLEKQLFSAHLVFND